MQRHIVHNYNREMRELGFSSENAKPYLNSNLSPTFNWLLFGDELNCYHMKLCGLYNQSLESMYNCTMFTKNRSFISFDVLLVGGRATIMAFLNISCKLIVHILYVVYFRKHCDYRCNTYARIC